jgi:hypothetical protein
MSPDPLDYIRWWQDLASGPWAAQARSVERYNELMQRVARGELDAEQLRDEFLRFTTEESSQYASEVARLGVEYWSSLLELGREYNDRFYDRVTAADSAERASTGAQEAGPRQVWMELRGEEGGEASGGFVIENKRDGVAAISFVVSDFVDAQTGTAFRPPLEIHPAWLSLSPREEAEIYLRLSLDEPFFRAGHRYATRIAVQGHDRLELMLTVVVDPAYEPATQVRVVQSAPAPPGKAASGGTAAKRGARAGPPEGSGRASKTGRGAAGGTGRGAAGGKTEGGGGPRTRPSPRGTKPKK